jgi:hypothetical protein
MQRLRRRVRPHRPTRLPQMVPEHVPCAQRRLDGQLTVVAGDLSAESTPSKLERLERQLNDTEVRRHTLGFGDVLLHTPQQRR